MADGCDAADSMTVSGGSIMELVDAHHGDVYRYALRLSGSTSDAEDLAQQTFLAAQLKLHQLRDPRSARSWLLTILRHCYLKSCCRQRPIPAAAMQLEIDSLPAELPDANLFETLGVDREQLQAALDELAPEFKIVVLMFYFEEQSYREIAEQLRLPIGTVMSRLSRAKTRLRDRLASADKGLALAGSISR
ncbi:MAG TPA: sigma-70 family RNA polymerase sigma factor [Pirellulales bacterium]|nr:sigma-70 family RNA polymerase sigma factor [Pirellulales bacterium]